MSKRHIGQQRRRDAGIGYNLRGPRYVVRQSRTVERHDFRRGRTEKASYFVVVDKQTDRPASEEFSEQAHAQQAADKLNGNPNRSTDRPSKVVATRPLRPQVEDILEKAGCLTGGCTRHKAPPMVTLHTDRDGWVVIRPVLPTQTIGSFEVEKVGEFQVGRCVEPLARAGFFTSEGRDIKGPFLRVTLL